MPKINSANIVIVNFRKNVPLFFNNDCVDWQFNKRRIMTKTQQRFNFIFLETAYFP